MKKIYIILFTICAFTSCADYLDRFPTDKPSSESFLQTNTELDLAINNAYRVLYYLSNNISEYLYLDGATDAVRIRGNYGGDIETISLGNHTPSTSIFGSTWNHFYTYIARCNRIINNINNVQDATDTERDVALSQALFLRAYAYGELISFFGDVPWVVNEIVSVNDGMLPRTDKSEILSNILNDLKYAEEKLPVKWDADNEGRATRWAAYALHARLALRFGLYDEAIAASQAVIINKNESGIDLYPNYEDLFNVNGVRCNEVILDIPFHPSIQYNSNPLLLGPRNHNGWAIIQPTVSLLDSYYCIDGLRIDQSPLYNQANPYENRDPRLKASIICDGTWYKDVRYETHPDSLLATKIVGDKEEKIQNQEVTNAYASHTGFLFRKYCDYTVDDVKTSTLNFILLRYAEVLLTYAEAKLEKGEIDQSLYDALNAVRLRAGMPEITETSVDKLRELIRNERKIELAGEGLRLFDIRRWKIAEHVLPGKLPGRKKKEYWFNPGIPVFDEYGIGRYTNQETVFQPLQTRLFNKERDYLWPIPQKEMDVNNKLVQNPNY